MSERIKLGIILLVFAAAWFLPVENATFRGALTESLVLIKWYAREHVLLCLVPAFFIAGGIGEFVSQGAVMKYLGPTAKKAIAYPVAAASGTILSVCSCTVLPLFMGIHKRGAGLGPATAFLYSGPAINVMAMVMTARVLGFELGLARAIFAVAFAVIIGLVMQFLFRGESDGTTPQPAVLPRDESPRSLAKNGLFFASLVGILVFANWSASGSAHGMGAAVHSAKWYITAGFGVLLAGVLFRWFAKEELVTWVDASWTFAKQILPLLLIGVFAAGFLLGSPSGGLGGPSGGLGGPSGGHGVIPREWIQSMVGGNSFGATFFASIAGAFMYFATLTEVPILEGLLNAGMGKGPALALLLAGPALSLPNMLVIRSVLGTTKTLTFIGLVVVLSTLAGVLYGTFNWSFHV